MRKSIDIESTSSEVARVLSVTDPIEGLEIDGRSYFIIEDYEDAPEVDASKMEIAYPFYNKTTSTFKWVVVSYQVTATEYAIKVEELNQTISLQNEKIASMETKLAELQSSTEENQIATYEALATILEVGAAGEVA